MSLCWLSPAQRPSLRELRIMLLHLKSSRDDQETAEFDRRWNQLMPRSPAAVPTALTAVIGSHDDDEEAEMNFSLAPPVQPKPDIPTTIMPMVHGLPSPGIHAHVRPGSFDSEFSSELNASLLAQAGSRQTSLHSLSTSPGNTPDDITFDDSFTVMSSRVPFTGGDRPVVGDVKADSFTAFEMINYGKIVERGAAEIRNEIKADVEIHAAGDIPDILPSSEGLSSDTPEHSMSQETAKGNFDSMEEGRQRFSDSSHNETMNNSANQESETICKSGVEITSEDVSDRHGEAVESGDHSVGNVEERDSKDGSFCMLKVSVGEDDDSPTKSLDVDSPVKSTTSSADWCLVSNHTEEHSKEEELDTVSHATDPSLPGDCVLVESRLRAGSEEVVNADAENVSACNTSTAVDKEQ